MTWVFESFCTGSQSRLWSLERREQTDTAVLGVPFSDYGVPDTSVRF